MPFSTVQSQRAGIKNSNKKQLVVTLQVRIHTNHPLKQNRTRRSCVKKAFLPVSLSASMTLEAALALSLFIFAVTLMILPMKIMNTDRKIQAALEAVGEDFSQYAYIKDVLEKGKDLEIPGAGEFAKEFCRHLGAGAAQGYAQVKVIGYADTTAIKHVRMLRSSIMEEDGIFDLILDYEIQMPFPVLGLKAVERTARCRRRAWIGKAGKDGAGGGEGEEVTDEIVYVGKTSTRYHKNRGCHYLENDLSAVAYEQVGALRNDGGGKYGPCRVCGAAAGNGTTVYIMPSGNSYHTSKLCTAIIAYVRAVHLSEVEYLGPCSYCSQ